MNFYSTLSILLILFFETFSLAINTPDHFKNSAPFFAEQDLSIPRNVIIFSFKGVTEKVPANKQGVFTLLEKMIEEGPSTISTKEYKKNLFLNGTAISAGSEYGLFKIYIEAPPQNTLPALSLLKETLSNLRTTEEDFSRFKSRGLSELNTSFEKMSTVITYFGVKDFFKYAPETMNGRTSPTSFEKLQLSDLKDKLPQILNYKKLFISYVGPTPSKNLKQNIETVFKSELKTHYQNSPRKKLQEPSLENHKYTVVHKEDATDNQIFILFPQSLAYGSPAWYSETLLQQILGGGLGGDLNKTLRVERGLTYGAYSRLSSQNFPIWYISTFGGLQQTKPLLKGIDEVLSKFVSSPSEKEAFDSAVEITLNAFQASRELALDRMSSQAFHYANDLDYKVIQNFPQKISNIKKDSMESFKTQLQIKNAAYYLMGNQVFLKKVLMELGVKASDIRVVNSAEIR